MVELNPIQLFMRMFDPENEAFNDGIMMFDEEDEETSDVCLVVQDRKFYCLKKHLARHSIYFRSMFFGKVSVGNNEITLEDPKKAEDFHLFLMIINGVYPFGDLTDENFFRVMALSKRWKAKVPYDQCFYHCVNSKRSTVEEKYWWAESYGLDELKEKLISNVRTVEQLGDILIVADPNKVDGTVKDALFSKSLALHGIRCRQLENDPDETLTSDEPRMIGYTRAVYFMHQRKNEGFLKQLAEMRQEQRPHRSEHSVYGFYVNIHGFLTQQNRILSDLWSLKQDRQALIPENTRHLLDEMKRFLGKFFLQLNFSTETGEPYERIVKTMGTLKMVEGHFAQGPPPVREDTAFSDWHRHILN